MTSRAQRFGGDAELLAKRTRECFVGAVAGLDRDRQTLGRTAGKTPRGFAQTTGANVAHDRQPGGRFESTRHVKTRYAGAIGNVVERQLAGKVTFDKPEGFSNRVHIGAHISMKPA